MFQRRPTANTLCKQAKAELEGAEATLTKEAIFHGVYAAIVHAGFTNTPMVRVLGEEYIKNNILPYTRPGRVIEPSEIAEAICFLISNSEISGQLKPPVVVTGSYLTIPITCRVLNTPLVWVVQSNWLPDFFRHGAGMTDKIRPAPVKAAADWFVMQFINFWIKHGFLNSVNRTANHFGVPGYNSIFEFWRGDITLVAEPPEFSGVTLPRKHYFIGPLIPQGEFTIPTNLATIPRDKPLIYFAMGSSSTPDIVAKIVESFEGKPYRVIAARKISAEQVPGVHVRSNVLVTDWVPALQVNKMADLAIIHGGKRA